MHFGSCHFGRGIEWLDWENQRPPVAYQTNTHGALPANHMRGAIHRSQIAQVNFILLDQERVLLTIDLASGKEMEFYCALVEAQAVVAWIQGNDLALPTIKEVV